MGNLKLLIVDDNPEVQESLSAYFNHNPIFEVVGTAENSNEAINILELVLPDVIILDLIMPVSDGFCLLDYLKKRKLSNSPKVVVLSCISHESVISRACTLGADYYVIKPYDTEVLKNRLLEVCMEKITNKTENADDLKVRITEMFSTLGIPEHTKGSRYLKDCISILIDQPDNIRNFSKSLYPIIASRYETNTFNVERSIRHTIDMTWNAAKEKKKSNSPILQFTRDSTKPSNRQFILKILKQLNIVNN